MDNNNGDAVGSRRDILRSVAAAGAASVGLSGAASGASSSGALERGTIQSTVGDGERTLTLRASDRAEYEFAVSGLLTPTSAPKGVVEDGQANARIGGTRKSTTDEKGSETSRETVTHEFRFSGEFTAFETNGEVQVFVDGDRFDVDSFPQNVLEVAPQGDGTATLDVSASGAVESESASLEQSTPRQVAGTISEPTTIAYAGELTYFDASGDVRLRRDSEPTTADELLPSTHPNELSIDAQQGTVDYTVTITNSAAVQGSASTATVDDGAIRGKARPSGTMARYAGSVGEVRHENGATATIEPKSRRIVCRAPEESSVEFTLKAEDGLIQDDTVEAVSTVTVEAGQTSRIQYFGDVTQISIGDLAVSMSPDRYPEAAVSARLQMAAEFERDAVYDRLSSNADGRVRHDADGVYAVSAHVDGELRDTVVYRLADIDRGHEGAVTITKARQSGETRAAKNSYEWKTNYDTTDKLAIDSLQLGGGVSAAAATFETEKADYDVSEERLASQSESVQPDSVPSPSPSGWLDDIWSGLTDLASNIAGVTADFLGSALDAAIDVTGVTENDFIVQSGKILANSFLAFQELAYQFISSGKIKAAWFLRLTGYSSIVSVAGSGIYEEIVDGDWSCTACVAIYRITIDVGVCGLGVSAFCGAIGFPTAAVGGVACGIALGAACSYISLALEDAKEMCSWGNEPLGFTPC